MKNNWISLSLLFKSIDESDTVRFKQGVFSSISIHYNKVILSSVDNADVINKEKWIFSFLNKNGNKNMLNKGFETILKEQLCNTKCILIFLLEN